MSHDKVSDALARTKAALPDHFATLVAERPRGSQWGRAPGERTLMSLDWRDVTSTVPEGIRSEGCTYFQADIGQHFPEARLGAIPLSEVNPSTPAVVTMGAHGPELVAPGAQASTKLATLIVGPHESEEVVFTVHPGAPLGAIRESSQLQSLLEQNGSIGSHEVSDLADLTPKTAVKLVSRESYDRARNRAGVYAQDYSFVR